MLFMVIEHFKEEGAAPVYKRFAEQGRMLPDGLKYIDSWIEADFNRCFQLMESEDATLFQKWVAKWCDLVDFEIVPVVPSAQTVRVFGEGVSNA